MYSNVWPCESATVKIYYHGTSQEPPFYRKFGPTTPGDWSSGAGWYDLPVTLGKEVVGAQTVGTATLLLQDNVLGDDTGDDGEIVDDGGLAQQVPVVPALRPTGLLTLTALLLGAGSLMLRRRLRVAN